MEQELTRDQLLKALATAHQEIKDLKANIEHLQWVVGCCRAAIDSADEFLPEAMRVGQRAQQWLDNYGTCPS